MARQRFQRGTLSTTVPGNATRTERKLPRGMFWGQWYQYVRQPDGSEKRRRREKIIGKELAAKHGFGKDYDGPLTKTDAQRVLEALIAEESGTFIAPDREARFADVAREYLALNEPNWGAHMVRAAKNLIHVHLITGPLGLRPVAEIDEVELQSYLNRYVQDGSSSSLLRKLLRHMRGIFKLSRKKKIVTEDPSVDLRARSRRPVNERALTIDECRRLLSVVYGRDHLILRMFIQLGLRPEEMFALRHDDVAGDQLRIDEAIVEGKPAPVKTAASCAFVFLPPDLAVELSNWMHGDGSDPRAWLFHPSRGRGQDGPLDAHNYLGRTLKPAAIRARVGLIKSDQLDSNGNAVYSTDVNFQALRRTCATLFGDRAKDPKSTQAQLRHADPSITLKHYQKSVPESVKAAALQFENDLNRPEQATKPMSLH